MTRIDNAEKLNPLGRKFDCTKVHCTKGQYRRLIHLNEIWTSTEGLFLRILNKGLVIDYSATAAKMIVTG